MEGAVFYVYVLQSKADGGLYIGFTRNLKLRIGQHQAREAFATSFRGPWKLIYYEAYLDEEDALGREHFLKSGSGRRFLDKQLAHYFSANPRRQAT
jgi:putative endonuclease